MIRLLVSLYFVVFVSIIAINQGSEFIWQHWVYQAPDDLRHAKQVAKSLQASVSEPAHLASSIQRYSIDEIAWLAEQREQLLQGDVITTYTERNDALLSFLLKDNATLVQLGPFQPAEQVLLPKYLLKLCSFLLLAVLLMFWLRPLWRDLMQLKYVTEQLSKGQLDISIARSRFSAIATLTSQFHTMATKVANLMSNQKHLVNAVSHELRTPLARLKFALAMLEKQAPEPVYQMSQDVLEMEVLIDEMLSYARLEMAQSTLQFKPFDIVALLNEQMKKLQRITKKQIELDCPFSQLSLVAERHYIARALQNLMVNAHKYGQENIYIGVKATQSHIMLLVGDDGKGIDEKEHAKVFEPFSRLEKSRNKSSGGFGLGLAIVAKIVAWHGGQCEIQTSQWGGALFVIYLPRSH
ncbi:Adaptive-response sensory-kinase SasA [Pseudoalteromonas sp. CIP111854]|uniref:histidine kinase n=1 Tax=Pseudoalteromonas holothuriae TaxID=2963714 RepID=A0A9W4W1J6_9GAMM|nr:ATP-binding protein [Pseudoalteromonas sp. CIP111854]CAH9062675.1 Adaptive-response sensory-kinase SasA [Pseudoalteromonas sp. CIP111854]